MRITKLAKVNHDYFALFADIPWYMAVLILVRVRDRFGSTKLNALEVKLILKAVLEDIPRIIPLGIGGV